MSGVREKAGTGNREQGTGERVNGERDRSRDLSREDGGNYSRTSESVHMEPQSAGFITAARSSLMRCLLTAVLTLSSSVLMAQATPTAESHVIVALPDKVTWSPAPNALPPGAKLAVLEGNPFEAGPYTMRLSMPGGYGFLPTLTRGWST